jgi:hypothetical protein
MDEQPLDLSAMHLDEIEELLEEALAEAGREISDQQMEQLAKFVQKIGNLETALALLTELDRKAA